jgi:hypothetical protein
MDRETSAIIVIRLALSVFALTVCFPHASAGEEQQHAAHQYFGRHGDGHNKWHEQFYSKLIRNDTKGSCCNQSDCVPTQSRKSIDGYEVMVEGEWTKVPPEVILNVIAPDSGAHVCFPNQYEYGHPKDTLYCVVLPPET